jgi:hypothetical protein
MSGSGVSLTCWQLASVLDGIGGFVTAAPGMREVTYEGVASRTRMRAVAFRPLR